MRKLGNQRFIFVVLASVLLFSGSLIAQNLKIYCIDVDQGMSTLIVAPNGKSILIDCGDRGKQDAVYDVITNEARLSSVDYFVCTHYHLDHYGCIKKLFEKGLTVKRKKAHIMTNMLISRTIIIENTLDLALRSISMTQLK